jgi:small subunit ribosomal protein S14
MRTVSFLGSFMAGLYGCGRMGVEPWFPTGRRELTGVKGVSNISQSRGKFCVCGELLLACGARTGHSPRPFFDFMAKTAWKEREKRKRKTVDKYAELRAELKKKGDYLALAQLPRNASPVRLSNRCRVSGRKRAYLREFQMSRLTFRELACAGLIPGVTKASW